MKQVNNKYYNKKYFDFQSSSPDFSKKIKKEDFHKKYFEIASLLPLKADDHICDYGCGTGDLSFLLNLIYKSKITSIDYSPDAINICKDKLSLFKKNTYSGCKIVFLNKNNENIPNLKKIKAVYFCDVFEHLYPKEIKFIIDKISKWGNPYLVVHTDNNFYLKYVNPIIILITLLTNKTNIKEIKRHKIFNKKRHINLTNPKKLSQEMKKNGYELISLNYPKITKKIIKVQLGSLSKFSFLVNFCYFFLNYFPQFSPSFYAIYKKI